jgi:putative membrane protein
MKLKKWMYVGGIFAGITLAGCGKDDNELNNTDKDFMTTASISNTAEVSAATMAITKATNGVVLAYAQHMIAEHAMAQTDLKNLGTSVGFSVKDTIDPAHVAIAAQLSALSGEQFDSAYIYSQIFDHHATSANFQLEQTGGQHRDVKNYANTYRPHIESHLSRADSIAAAFYRQ